MAGLPAMQVFSDVTVVPVRAVAQHVALGGPIWPDFDRQTAARHCRDARPVDLCPPPRAPRKELTGPAVWGGFLDPQFGHLIVEQLTRLPQSLAERPDDTVLFTLPPKATAADVPDWTWALLAWFGLPRDRVRLVGRTFLARRLHVAAQGEMMGTQPTSPDYLDLLDPLPARRGLTPETEPVVFVTRAGLVARGQGGHAGEGYLAGALARAGVRVIDPVRHSVRRQLEIYAGARVLVFSEGSALQGRLLLGRLAQDIHVLRRRPNRDLAAEQLAPRCTRLQYHAAVGQRLGARMPGGIHRLDLTAALYDLAPVFDLFARLGHDLRPHWDAAAYHAAVTHDLRGWFAACITAPDQQQDNLAGLAAAGYDIDPPHTAAPCARQDTVACP